MPSPSAMPSMLSHAFYVKPCLLHKTSHIKNQEWLQKTLAKGLAMEYCDDFC